MSLTTAEDWEEEREGVVGSIDVGEGLCAYGEAGLLDGSSLSVAGGEEL